MLPPNADPTCFLPLYLPPVSYQPPFDTHRWLVNRCGTEITYLIDFYTGSSKPRFLPSPTPGEAPVQVPSAEMSFYLDVRPVVNSWDGMKTRLGLGRSAE